MILKMLLRCQVEYSFSFDGPYDDPFDAVPSFTLQIRIDRDTDKSVFTCFLLDAIDEVPIPPKKWSHHLHDAEAAAKLFISYWFWDYYSAKSGCGLVHMGVYIRDMEDQDLLKLVTCWVYTEENVTQETVLNAVICETRHWYDRSSCLTTQTSRLIASNTSVQPFPSPSAPFASSSRAVRGTSGDANGFVAFQTSGQS